MTKWIEAQFVNKLGRKLDGFFQKEEFKMLRKDGEGFVCIWYRQKDGCIRYPKTKDKRILELQRKHFGKTKGERYCLSDLMINSGF